VIVGAWADDNNSASGSGSAFIFFGGITGDPTPLFIPGLGFSFHNS